jgi:hypothetical protein
MEGARFTEKSLSCQEKSPLFDFSTAICTRMIWECWGRAGP